MPSGRLAAPLALARTWSYVQYLMRALLEKLPPGVVLGSRLGGASSRRKVLAVTEPFASVLPDGGLPRGAVVELSAPAGLAGGCSFALEACAAAQRESRARGGESAWCAWLDPDGTLNAPAAALRGVDLERLLVVRPPRSKLATIAVRVAASRVFSVVVVDTAGLPCTASPSASLAPWIRSVRRLALGVEEGDTVVVLLTDALVARPSPLPAAMRIELERSARDRLSVRIAKERHGRIAPACTIPFPHPSTASGEGRADHREERFPEGAGLASTRPRGPASWRSSSGF